MANAGTGPDVATRIPPSAGPSTVPTCTAAELIAFPACRLSAGSSDGMIANEAGMNSPSPAPSRAATGASQASVARCRAASTVSATASRQRASVRAEHQAARPDPVGQHPAQRDQRRARHAVAGQHGAQQHRAAVAGQHEPGQRHRVAEVADGRRGLPGGEQPEVAVGQRAARRRAPPQLATSPERPRITHFPSGLLRGEPWRHVQHHLHAQGAGRPVGRIQPPEPAQLRRQPVLDLDQLGRADVQYVLARPAAARQSAGYSASRA